MDIWYTWRQYSTSTQSLQWDDIDVEIHDIFCQKKNKKKLEK